MGARRELLVIWAGSQLTQVRRHDRLAKVVVVDAKVTGVRGFDDRVKDLVNLDGVRGVLRVRDQLRLGDAPRGLVLDLGKMLVAELFKAAVAHAVLAGCEVQPHRAVENVVRVVFAAVREMLVGVDQPFVLLDAAVGIRVEAHKEVVKRRIWGEAELHEGDGEHCG